MTEILQKAKLRRTFVAPTLIIQSWSDIEPYYTILADYAIHTPQEALQWLQKRSELEAVLEEEFAWRYIRMNCDTNNKEYARYFSEFVEQIQPHIQKKSNELDKKILAAPAIVNLPEEYKIALRDINNREELFVEKNIPIHTELQTLEQEYGTISSQMTVNIQGETKTLQQAATYLKDTDRELRKEVFMNMAQRRLENAEELHLLLDSLISKRHEIAINAGFENYRDYKHKELGRFDYTKEDCFTFHASIQKNVPPIVQYIHRQRQEALGYEELFPWDLDVDKHGNKMLKPFTDTDDFIHKSVACFNAIDADFGKYLRIMYDNGYMDLDSRVGKAPGGFNYPLYESNMPFIFMNAAGSLTDLTTLMHEGGHALHSFYSSHLPIVEFKSLPSEVAELASMSMELISMEHWDVFFSNPQDAMRAKQNQLEGVLSILSWIAIVDSFQHALYVQPKHSHAERTAMWMNIVNTYKTNTVNWQGLEKIQQHSWQKQLHIFEVPFYYIEYGIAQLGALSMWKNYKENPAQTIENYKNMLAAGYTKPIPEIYKIAGIEFNFSQEYVASILQYAFEELKKLS